MDKTSILIADDHAILRHGLRNSLEENSDFDIIADTDSGREAVKLASELNPDIILMDITMPELNGMEATKQIITNNPEAKIIALSMHLDKLYVMGMLNSGASGYLLKSCSFKELQSAITEVLSGKTYLCSDVTQIVVDQALTNKAQKKPSLLTVLSQREREILQLIAEGNNSKRIADILFISKKTVEAHKNNIKKKLGIKNIAGLTKLAIKEGLTSFHL